MRKIILLLCLTFLSLNIAWGQDEKLPGLLEEREQLILEYQFYNKQNSNFWGKKSKKDLIQIVQTLKNIINKDSEIIREINITSLKKVALSTVETTKIQRQVADDQRLTVENLHQLKQELGSLQNLVKVKDRQILELRDNLQEARDSRQNTDVVIAVAGGTCLLLLLYIFMLRSKLSASRSPARRKK